VLVDGLFQTPLVVPLEPCTLKISDEESAAAKTGTTCARLPANAANDAVGILPVPLKVCTLDPPPMPAATKI